MDENVRSAQTSIYFLPAVFLDCLALEDGTD